MLLFGSRENICCLGCILPLRAFAGSPASGAQRTVRAFTHYIQSEYLSCVRMLDARIGLLLHVALLLRKDGLWL